jgi:hypothetical protein
MTSKLETLQQRRKQLDAQIQAIKAREARNARALDTRKKIVVGGALFRAIKCGDVPDTILRELIEKHVSEKDKKMFV